MLNAVSPPCQRERDARGLPASRQQHDPRTELAPNRARSHLVELRRYVDHIREIRPFVRRCDVPDRDLSLHNDVLFSWLMIGQLAIDVASELSARRGQQFEDHMRALRNLVGDRRFPPDVVRGLESLLGFRNRLIQGHATPDKQSVLGALDGIESIERFVDIVREIDSAD